MELFWMENHTSIGLYGIKKKINNTHIWMNVATNVNVL
jgi:hypothetical protein